MNIILIGPPGCGKGTQAEHICDKYGLTYISTGNIIREEIAARTQIGMRAKALIDSGHFLDDQTVLDMVRSALSKIKNGVLFDGFPRTLNQAFALEHLIPIHAVLDIEVSEKEVVRRISSRWMVEHNHEQHTFTSKDDADSYVAKNGGHAFQRDDDKESVVVERLKVYHKQTEPLIAFYGKKHKIYTINGEKSINNVWKDIQNVLNKKIHH
jgi:adenylate kinase